MFFGKNRRAGALVFLCLAACGGHARNATAPFDAPTRSGWDLFNQPEVLAGLHVYTTRFADLPAKAELESKPWRGAFWPDQAAGIAARWQWRTPHNFAYVPPAKSEIAGLTQAEISRLSPAEKLDIYNGRFDYPTFERERARTDARALPWEGLCDGLAVSQLLYAEPKPVLMKGADGVSIPFGSADVKALLAYEKGVLQRPRQDVVGVQCTAPDSAANARCKSDMNAGTFHVVLANQVGVLGRAFLADVDWTAEVWNHVVYGYSTNVTAERAPSSGAAAGTEREILVETTVRLSLIREPAWAPEPANDDLDGYQKYAYALELDARGRIVGGEWLSEEHPDFLWNVDPAEGAPEKLSLGIEAIYRASVASSGSIPPPQ